MYLNDFFEDQNPNYLYLVYVNNHPATKHETYKEALKQAEELKYYQPDFTIEVKKIDCREKTIDVLEAQEPLYENLRKWFKEKWVRFGPDGKIRGQCARDDDSEGKPKCLPQAKAHALGKKGRKYAASKKRRDDPNPERHGAAINVATKKKSNEGVTAGKLNEIDYADALDSGYISPDNLMRSGQVVGDIEGNDIVMIAKGNQTVYILKVNDRATALVGFEGKNLKNIKNFTQTSGVIRALIGYLVHKQNMKIEISPDEPLTFDGLKWLLNLIRSPRGLVIKDQTGKNVDPAQLKQEWQAAKNTGTPGTTGIIISESIQFGNKIRANEARRDSDSLLMPFNFYSVKSNKQGVAEGELAEIGYSDKLGDLNVPTTKIISSAEQIGTISQKPVMKYDQGNATLFFFTEDDRISALVLVADGNKLRAIKNFSGQSGQIYALINYIVNIDNRRLIITPDEPLTKEGLQWIVKLIKKPSGLKVTSLDGGNVNIETLKTEWLKSKSMRGVESGETGIVISESSQEWKNKLQENETRLMPHQYFNVTDKIKQGVAEGNNSRQHLDFDSLYGKFFKITDNSGDPDRPGFSIVTPLNGESWNWRERPELKEIVKQKLNDPEFLGDHKYQQIVDAMAGNKFNPNKHLVKEVGVAEGSYSISDFKINAYESMADFRKWMRSPKKNDRGMTRRIVDIYENIVVKDNISKEANQTFVKRKQQAKEFSENFKRFDQRDKIRIKIGNKISLLSSTIIPDDTSSRIELSGFITPKKIVKINLDEGKIDSIKFDDGSIFPETSEFTTVGGVNITNTIFFPDAISSSKAYTAIWMYISNLEGKGWTVENYISEGVSKSKLSQRTKNSELTDVIESNVVKGRFGQKFVPQLGRTIKTSKYERNPDIDIPMYDSVNRRVWHAGISEPANKEPFDHFETRASQIGTAIHIIGVTKSGMPVQVSTTTSEDLAQVLVDAYNRGGFTDVPIEKVSLAPDNSLKEFAPPGEGNGDDGFSEETLKMLAAQWWNGDEDPEVERTLELAGWEIGIDEGYDNGGVFVVQAGDDNGDSFLSWPAEELEGLAETKLNEACWKGYHKEGNKKMFGKTYPNCVKNTNEDTSQDLSSDNVRRIQQLLNKKFNANLDVDGIMGPLTAQSIKKFLPKSSKKAAPNPNRTTAVQGNKVKEENLNEKWSQKYKRSINCNHPKGFSQRAHCQGRKKKTMKEMKTVCPECGGLAYSNRMLAEKQDACYHKVKSRYKVWPSAYASGALVQCRKKGAKNWGTKNENYSLDESLSVGSSVNLTKNYSNFHNVEGKVLEITNKGKYRIQITAATPKTGKKAVVKQGDIITIAPNYIKQATKQTVEENKIYFDIPKSLEQPEYLRTEFKLRHDNHGWYLRESQENFKKLYLDANKAFPLK